MAALHTVEAGILLWIQEHLRCALLTTLLVPFTTTGNHGELWIVLCLLLILSPKTRKGGVLALISLLLCFLFNDFVLKLLVARPRPFTAIESLRPLIPLPSDYSFPSGHSNSSFAVAFGAMRGVPQKWLKLLLVVLACLMAFSRLYVGVHYPTDVLAGSIEGILGSTLVWCFLSKPYDRQAKRLSEKENN